MSSLEHSESAEWDLAAVMDEVAEFNASPAGYAAAAAQAGGWDEEEPAMPAVGDEFLLRFIDRKGNQRTYGYANEGERDAYRHHLASIGITILPTHDTL